MAIVGMGKLGGGEMTATSDLDLIFVYSASEQTATSDGPRPLPPSQYFARLSQRLINALTAPTAEGRLYEVDMRLRPSGKAGPIAVSATTFAHYQCHEAWVWEQMALTRARVVAGPPELRRQIEAIIKSVLTHPRDPDPLIVEVADMRTRMAKEHKTESIWQVKHLRGGLVDIEFIAQYLQLRHAHLVPEVLSPNTRTALITLCTAGLIAPGVAAGLIEALDLWQAVQSRIRLNIGQTVSAIDGDDAPKYVRLAVSGINGLEFKDLVRKMQSAAGCVQEHFRTLIAEPAEAARARLEQRHAKTDESGGAGL
jgi:glutamate-ammonia-ligase adenylyltransferase